MSSLTKLAGMPRLSLDHRFGAPPAAVYATWVEPERLARWFGPAGAVVLTASCDVRVGGGFHVHYRAPDGEEHEVSGLYRDVVPDRRLEFTWVWHRQPEQESLVSVELAPDGAGTRLSLAHEQLAGAGARTYLRTSWAQAFDKLEAYLATHPDTEPTMTEPAS